MVRRFNWLSYYLRVGIALPIGFLGMLLLSLSGLISGELAHLTVTLRGKNEE